MMELRLSVRHHGDRATIHIGGEIDLATCPQLQAVVVDLVDRGCYQLILDLEQVSFMDCAGIGVLVDARRRVQEARRFCEAGQAQTAGVAGAGADRNDNGAPNRHPRRGGNNADHVAACCRIPRGLSCCPPQPSPAACSLPTAAGGGAGLPRCPNRAGAIALAERVCAELGSNAEIQVLEIADQQAAEQARSLGSPTIRVDGRDVEPGAEECVEYLHLSALSGQAQPARAPEEVWLRQALQDAQVRRRQLDVAALAAEVAAFLDQVGRRGDRRQAELPAVRLLGGRGPAPAMRAAELGIDPTPWLDVVAAVFRLYADALKRPNNGT